MKKLIILLGFILIPFMGMGQVSVHVVTRTAPTPSYLYTRTATASDSLDVSDWNDDTRTGKIVRMNVSGANNLTVVANSIKGFPVGCSITVEQMGAGQTTIVAGAGVTINSVDGAKKLNLQYSTATLIKTDTDTWLLIGDITN